MAKIDVLNVEGTKVDSIEIADSIFAITPNQQALNDAILLQRSNMRQGTHKVKGRSEVRGGGAKPWRQKGTGRARQGTIRAPQWKGGGIVFGPTPRKYTLKMNKKVRRLALRSALAEKFQAGELIVIDQISFDVPKTKEMVNVMTKLNAPRKPLLVTGSYDENVFLAGRNVNGLINLDAAGINVLDVVNAHKLILTKDAVSKIEEVLA